MPRTVRAPPRFAARGPGRYRLAMTRFLGVLMCVLALAGCPGKRKPIGMQVPTNGDPEARARFLEAQASFRRGGEGAEELGGVVEEMREGAVAPDAEVYNGIALIGSKDYAAAEKALVEIANTDPEEADKGLRLKARMYLGIAKNYQGQHARALPFLRDGEQAAQDDKEKGEWL